MTLIDEARQWWKMWSNRLALVAGAAFGALVYDPTLLRQAVALVPEPWRPLAAFAGAVAVSASAIGARVVKQDKLCPPDSTGQPKGTNDA